jgi:Zn-dependent protease
MKFEWLLYAGLFYLLLRAGSFAFIARLVFANRGRVRPYVALGETDVPAHVRELVERAAEPWRELGFSPLGWAEQGSQLLGVNPDRASHALVLFREADPRFVWLAVAHAPDHGSATRATVVSDRADGTHVETEGEIGAVASIHAPGYEVALVSGGSPQELLDSHARIARAGIPAALDGLAAHLERRFDATRRVAEHALATGQLRCLPDGALEYGTRTALTIAWRHLLGSKRAAAQKAERRAAAAGSPPLPIEIELEQWEDHEILRARPLRRSFMLAVFGVTAVLAALSFSPGLSLPLVGTLMVVVFLHELGHVVAMRLRGYSNTSIFFVPLFGAVATGRKQRPSLGDEMVVLLAGPVPGLVAGLALFAAAHVYPITPFLGDAAAMLIAVNAFNLLPLAPLDGGRIVHRLVADGRPRLEIALQLVSAVGLILAALWLGAYLLAPLGFFFLFSLRGSSAVAKVETELRAVDLPTAERRTAILRALRGPLAGANAGLRILRAVQLDSRLDAPRATGAARTAWMGCYLGILVSPIVLVAGPWHSHRSERPDYVWLECGASPDSLDLGSKPRPIFIAPIEPLPADLRDELDVYGRARCSCLPPPWIGPLGDAAWRRRAAGTLRTIDQANGAWYRAHPPPEAATLDAAVDPDASWLRSARTERPAFLRTELARLPAEAIDRKLANAILRREETNRDDDLCALLQADEPCHRGSPRLAVYDGAMMVMAQDPARDLETVTSFLCRRGVPGVWVVDRDLD